MKTFDQDPRRYYMGHNIIRLIINMATNYQRLLLEELWVPLPDPEQEVVLKERPPKNKIEALLIKWKLLLPKATKVSVSNIKFQKKDYLKQIKERDRVDIVMEALMETRVGRDCRVFDFKAAPGQKVHVHVLDGKVLPEDDVLEATVIAATVCYDDEGNLVYKYMTDMTDVAQLDAGDFNCCKPMDGSSLVKEAGTITYTGEDEDDETESC